MISLVKLHFSYLFSWKIIYISLVIVVISLISFVFLSQFYLDSNLLVFYSENYQDEYVYSGLSLIKIVVLIESMFIVINGFVINKYDVYLVMRRDLKSVILSKIITMVFGSMVFTSFLFLLMNITGLFLTEYYTFSSSYIDLYYDLMVFSVLYTLLYIFLIILIKNMYSLLGILTMYFVSNISLEYLVIKSDLSWFSKVINLVFIDVGFFKDIGYDLFYSNTYYLALCFVFLELILLTYSNSDILN